MITELFGKEEVTACLYPGSIFTQALLQETVVVLDCCAINYIDVMGIDAISHLFSDAKKKNTSLFISSINGWKKLIILNWHFQRG